MPLDLDLPTMRRLAARVSDLVTEHLSTLRDQPAQRSLGRVDAERLIGEPNRIAPETGTDFDALLGELTERVFPYHAREPHPRFLGYIPSIPTFPAVLGDWLATGYDFFAGVWPVAAGPNEIELVVLDWFRQWLGMPVGTGGLLTSGGSAATVTAVVAARDACLTRLGSDPALLPRLVVYTSDQAHSSVARAAWIAGIARGNLRVLPTDESFRMGVEALRGAIAADRAAGLVPCLVVASAGTTNTGAIDPLEAVADVCAAEERLWLHVDAAYGGFAALTDAGHARLAGIGRADSVTLDPHKWLFVPFECGCLLARDPAALKAAFHIIPEYLKDVQPGEEEVNFADYGEQLTRYSRALKVWLSVRYFGLAPIRAAIAGGVARAERMERLLRARGGFEILSPARLGILCFRARPDSSGGDAGALDALNERVNARVNGTGRWLMSSTKLRGAYSLRVCTHNWRTTDADVDELVETIAAAVAEG